MIFRPVNCGADAFGSCRKRGTRLLLLLVVVNCWGLRDRRQEPARRVAVGVHCTTEIPLRFEAQAA